MEECSGDLERNSCLLLPVENGEKDALAAVRMMVSLLSMLGVSAIIASIIRRKHIWSPTMHPIFQLSIADFLLGILWIVGSWLWFRGTSNRAGCFSVSLFTVILECVTANLTLVYAVMAYWSLKRKRKTTTSLDILDSPLQILSPLKSTVMYILAWVVPVLVVLALFGGLSATTRLVSDANKCSCWCFPHLGNVLPYSHGRDEPSSQYLKQIHKLQLGYSVLLLLQFLIVLIIMTWLYRKVMQEIKAITIYIAALDNDLMTDTILRGQALARKRIILYLTVFLGITLSFVILTVLVISCAAETLSDYGTAEHKFFIIVHLFQSITVPMQGFLNCIIYGWTSSEGNIMGGSADMVMRVGKERNPRLQDEYEDTTAEESSS